MDSLTHQQAHGNHSPMNLTLRPYQRDAVNAVLDAFRSGVKRTLVVHPTGCGKTVVFSSLLATYAAHWRRNGVKGCSLVLAHRGQLVEQGASRIRADTGLSVAVEMADERAASSVAGGDAPDVVMASVQSIVRRLDQYHPGAFKLIIVDEAHHAVPGSDYDKIVSAFPNAVVLGVTATPDRLDGVGMGAFFETAAHTYDIFEAIQAGWLVPVEQRRVLVEAVDLSGCKISRITKDYDEGDLASRFMTPDALIGVADPLRKLSVGRKTVAFTVSKAHAHALAQMVNTLNDDTRAVAVTGDTSRAELAEIIADFRDPAGHIRSVFNCQLLTEGFDAPEVSCVAMARPTRSRALYAQCMGRGTRLAPHVGKTDLLALDFVPRGAKVGLIGPANVLDGSVDGRTAEMVDEITRKSPNKSVSDAILEAREALAGMDRQAMLDRAKFRVLDASEINIVELLGIQAAAGRWGGVSASDGQLRALEKCGVQGASDYDRGQASAILDAITKRREEGRCTLKQAMTLARHGLNPDVSFKDAGDAITAIAGNRWKAPEWLKADPRFRPAA